MTGAEAVEAVDALARALARDALLGGLSPEERRAFAEHLEIVEVPAGERVIEETDTGDEMFFVVEGEARLRRAHVDLGTLGPGAHFGELSLIAARLRAASVVSVTRLVLARLTRARYDALSADHPALSLRFTQALVGSLGSRLTEMTDSVGLLLRERSLPRRVDLEVPVSGERRRVRTGTPVRAVLPAQVGGAPVVAALLGNKAVALDTPIISEAPVEPLTTDHWEGKRVYRQSLGLLLLEAAARVDPDGETRLGPSIGFAQRVVRSGPGGPAPAVWVEKVARMMGLLVAIDARFRHELWSVDEARSHFEERGARDAVMLLRAQRDGAASLVSCGDVYALGMGPLLPSTGLIGGFAFHLEVVPAGGFLLRYGDEPEDAPSEVAPPSVVPAAIPAPSADTVHRPSSPPPLLPRRADGGDELWLGALGVTSVGAFNEACIVGSVSQIIRVCEGLHEKRIGQIADTIAERAGRVRLITIAGPSSSGKTTFIKRLTVQLQVNGIHPAALSLDDYYLDRERTPLDEHGRRDYEAVEALDLPLLNDHLCRLLAGDEVKTARFDFPAGQSRPDGGPTLALHPTDVLLLEGIHGLNPRLLEAAADHHRGVEVFRVFIQPTSALPFDALNRVNASDLRLLRRIVRDRHQRGTGAAENIVRWPLVRAGERKHIFPFLDRAHAVFDSALVYEPSVIKVFADRYLLEVPEGHPAFVTAHRLRRLIDNFVTIYPDHVPPTSILREFIGGSGFEY